LDICKVPAPAAAAQIDVLPAPASVADHAALNVVPVTPAPQEASVSLGEYARALKAKQVSKN